MTEKRERELKLSLEGRAAFDRLRSEAARGRVSEAVRNEDHYFDTADLRLLRRGAVLRLRRSKSIVLTFKQGREEGDAAGFFDAVEIDEPLDEHRFHEMLQRPALILERGGAPAREVARRFGPLVLSPVGVLRTERTRIHMEYTIELDRIELPDGSELFELEIETDDAAGARRWIGRRLAALGIRTRPQRRIKLQLLLEWLERRHRQRPS